MRYKIDTAALRSPDFYIWQAKDDRTVWVTINTRHPFFDEIYEQSASSDRVRFALECVVLASVRADMTAKTQQEIEWNKRRMVSWSNAFGASLYIGRSLSSDLSALSREVRYARDTSLPSAVTGSFAADSGSDNRLLSDIPTPVPDRTS